MFPWSWCSISWKITRTSSWFTIYTRKNENWKSRKVATKYLLLLLVTKFCGKTECVIHLRNLKQASDYRLILTKFRRVIKFDQKAWLKPYIDMNTKLR